MIFNTLACEKLDDRQDVLRAEYSLDCRSKKHREFMVYAGYMI
ncbi:unnamed protein product [Discosporangium mesarthrocarpum]